MKIESVRIKNFRSFADETIPFNDYTCLVGPNGAGKSTIPCALILLIGGDKTGKDRFYEEYVPVADDLYDTHLEELKAEGLI
jgi:predicted ATP-dependent endonuclease of OLD family